MYINKENNMSYPNVINDLNVDINCERLFDKLYLNFNKYQKIKNSSKSQADDSTVYERADFITFIEQNPNFLNKFGMVSSSKLVDYSAEILMKQSLLNYSKEKKSKIDMNKAYDVAKKLVIQDSKNFRGKDKQSRVPNGQPFSYNSTSYYGNQKQQRTNYVQHHTNNAQPQVRPYDDLSGLKIPSFMSRKDYHDYNRNDYNDYRVHQKKKNSNSNKSKRTIKGANRTKKLLYTGIALSTLIASLSIVGINHSIANRNLINNTSYQTAQSNSIPSSMYLSNSGDKNNLLRSPMFGSDCFKDSKMFSDENEFDNFLLKTYVNSGNSGINNYIFQKLNSGEMYSVDQFKNLAKANEIYSLSVMQDEFINSLGNNRNPSIKYASFDKVPILENDFKSGEYSIKFYDKYGSIVSDPYYSDKYVSEYINNFEQYVAQINTKFDNIESKREVNSNYQKSVDCYKDLIEINEIISKFHKETNTFAVRNHQKHFSIPDNKIVTKGVDFNSKEEVDKMKIDSDHNNDDRDGR